MTRVTLPGIEPQTQKRTKSGSDQVDAKSVPRTGSLASTASSSSFTSVSSMSSGASNGTVIMDSNKIVTNGQGNHPLKVNGSIPDPSNNEILSTSPSSHYSLGVKVLPDMNKAMFGSTAQRSPKHLGPGSSGDEFLDNTPKFPTEELLATKLQQNAKDYAPKNIPNEFKMNGVHFEDDENLADDLAAKHQTVCFDELSLGSLTDSQQDLRALHDKMVEERKAEQRMAQVEKQRLDEILNMCAEYEKQLEKVRV